MTILVTGGAGGIGSTLIRKLIKHGYRVISVDTLQNGYIENLQEDNKKHICANYHIDIRDTNGILK